MARASSGSRSSIRSIDPLMSANSILTVLRSPSSLSAADASETRIGASLDFLAGPAEATSSGAPQSSQNLAVAELSAPHLVHRFDIGLPHSGQNFLPDVLSVPHLEQCIEPPVRASTTHGCYIRPRIWKSPPNEPVFRSWGPQVFPSRQARPKSLRVGDANCRSE